MRVKSLFVVFCVALACTVYAHEETQAQQLAEVIHTLSDRLSVLEQKLSNLEQKFVKLEKNVHAGHAHNHDDEHEHDHDHSHDEEEEEEEDASKKEVLDESNVVVLDGTSFDSAVAENELTLVEFYAPWCGHCKALAPHYARAATRLAGGKHGVLAKVDCTADANRNLCDKHGVQGFPTVKLFRKGSSNGSDYSGERDADAIYKFMVRQSSPAVSVLTSSSAVENFGEGEAVKVVAFVNDESLAGFTSVAEALRNDFPFAAVRNIPDVAAHFKTQVPSVVVFRDFDQPAIFTGAFDGEKFADELKAFITAESFPAIGSIGPENYLKYVERGLNFAWIFYDPSDASQETLLASLIPIATQHKSRLSFVKLDGKMWSDHAKNFGLGEKLPSMAIEEQDTNKRFLFDDKNAFTAENFGAFVQAYFDKTLTPFFKSEPEPEDNSGPVKVVVGSSFDKIVMDDSKDVLVEFYAPWCGHCKALAPKFEDLGRMFAADSNIVIAKVDATANDTPEKIEGFPTLKFYPAGDKSNPISYSGDRSVEGMAEFINENRKSAAPNKTEL